MTLPSVCTTSLPFIPEAPGSVIQVASVTFWGERRHEVFLQRATLRCCRRGEHPYVRKHRWVRCIAGRGRKLMRYAGRGQPPAHPSRSKSQGARYKAPPPTRSIRRHRSYVDLEPCALCPEPCALNLVPGWVAGRYSKNRGSRNSQIRLRIQCRPNGVIEKNARWWP